MTMEHIFLSARMSRYNRYECVSVSVDIDVDLRINVQVGSVGYTAAESSVRALFSGALFAS